jgi:3-hydroxymyristoyl/3-hydroxydecanoyl-(acyl carrier protein) dehydratase
VEAEFLWTVPEDHPAFPGHFPGNPIVPGVVLLDRAILFSSEFSGIKGAGWQVANAKFLSPVGPEEALRFLIQKKPNGGIAFRISAQDRDVASGALTPPAP